MASVIEATLAANASLPRSRAVSRGVHSGNLGGTKE
jgi:hypothetical protein